MVRKYKCDKDRRFDSCDTWSAAPETTSDDPVAHRCQNDVAEMEHAAILIVMRTRLVPEASTDISLYWRLTRQ